ncbi:uncharacterized protein TNCV_1385611 [Trichonephila clavipes]|nr:uncharacterized protein TNCV_1385611 [Trichonephila clavipes]
MEEIGGVGMPLRSLWHTLHCRREVSAADKRCRVHPLDPRPDAVALYSGCRRAWFLPDDRHTASLVGQVALRTYGSNAAGKGLVLPTLNVNRISQYVTFPNNEIAVHKAFIGIGGEPKYVRSGDLLIETNSATQSPLSSPKPF